MAPGLLPLIGRNDNLRALAPEYIRAQHMLPDGLPVVVGQVQSHGSAGVVVPDLGLVDAVPVAPAGRRLEEVVDGRRDGAVAVRLGVPEGLDKVALFNVGLQAEFSNDLLRREAAAAGTVARGLRLDRRRCRQKGSGHA